MKRTFTLSLFLGGFILMMFPVFNVSGQSSETIKPMQTNDIKPIVCYFTPENMHTAVPFRKTLEQITAGRTNAFTSTFIVEYTGFTPERQAAFQYAVDIWASLLVSDVPIRIRVAMSSDLGDGTLASTGWGGLNANFDYAQRVNTWYVVSLAEKIAGKDLNDPTFPDIVMNFNSKNAWYTGTDGNTPANQYDLVSVALHEIGHGLGFYAHTFVDDTGTGSYGNNVNDIPMIYTQHIEDSDGKNLVQEYTNNTKALGTALTGGSLYFNSISFPASQLPRLYAPASFSTGSSIAHLNEATYPAGNANSLMTPQIGAAESVHDPGLSLLMLEDMGWITMRINHVRLTDTEATSGAVPVTAVITGDNKLVTDGAVLHYTYSDFANETMAVMTATGNPDEYTANIPLPGSDKVISYYIEAKDNQNKVYTSPGEAPGYFHQFVAAPDTIAPEIIHQALNFVFTFDPVAKIRVTVKDNIGVGDLTMTYKKNGVPGAAPITIPLVSATNDGEFIGEYALDWDLTTLSGGVAKGDEIEYQLKINDVSVASNQGIHPGVGFNAFQIDALNPAATKYTNDFNSVTADFVGTGFTIGSATGFNNNAIHSDHPYRLDRGVSAEDTLVLSYLLKTPIILAANNATIRFDEVVLIEPGEGGSVFGDDDFWDYVTVEGSSDFGVTWHTLTPGYDSRANQDWLTHWESKIVITDNVADSEAEGNSDLYKPRTIDMLSSGDFQPGDEVLIRFKLFADQLAVGWGWAIDNLKVQVDDEGPEISHIAPDYLNIGDTQLTLVTKVTDNAVLDSVTFEVIVDGQTKLIGIDQEVDIYTINLGFNAATANTQVKYRIIAVDSAATPNTSYLPVSGYFEIPVADLGAVKTVYINDFNTITNDFIGSNFTVATETGFTDNAIQSLHPYSNAPTGTASMSYLLKYPIKLNNDYAWMGFDEVAIIDPLADRVVIEASNDNGVTWHEIGTPYHAYKHTEWSSVYTIKDGDGNSIGVPDATAMKYHLVDILSNPNINGGDEVLIRFTLRVDAQDNAWGWTIDNLEIQGPTTGIDDGFTTSIQVYPNPSVDGRVQVVGDVRGGNTTVRVTDVLGKPAFVQDFMVSNNRLNAELDLSGLNKGIYIIQVITGTDSYATRVIIK